MKKRILRQVMLLAVVAIMFLGVIVLGGCANDEYSIKFVVIEDAFSANFSSHPTANETGVVLELVRSEDEFMQLTEKYSISLNRERDNDDFFVDRAIIIISFETGAGNRNPNINNLRVSGNLLEIHRTNYTPRGGHDARYIHLIILEVNQSDIVEVTKMQIIVRQRRMR